MKTQTLAAPKAKKLTGEIILNHARSDEPGMTYVWKSQGKAKWPMDKLTLAEFNHVVFTCNRFGIPLRDADA